MSYPQQPQPMYQPSKKRKKWPWVLGAGAAAFVVLAAVGGGTAGSNSTTPAAPVVPTVETPVEVVEAAPQNEGPVRLGFGESHTWNGGEKITISAPVEHTESNQFLAAPEGKRYVAFDVTIHNGGDSEHQVMQTKLTVQHNGRVAQQNYTAGDVLPDVQLPPGGETTFTAVYEIGEEPGELQVSVQPNVFAADTVYFTGQF